MTSIRRYLLRTLIFALIGGSLITSFVVYLNATHEINELYDKNMEEVAELLQSQMQHHPLHRMAKAAHPVGKLKNEEEMLIQVWKESGALIYSSYPNIHFPLQLKPGPSSFNFEETFWHVYRTNSNGTILQVAQPYAARRAFVREMAMQMLYPMLGQIPFLAFLIWLAVGKSLVPLARISGAIHRRSASILVPLETNQVPTEIQPMLQELNALLHRLESTLNTQQQFTMDAAHELRTPLAALKLQLGNLERAKEPVEHQNAIAKLHSGIDRASHVVQQLLTLARLEPEASHPNRLVDLSQLASHAIESYAELAYAKHIDLGYARSEPAFVSGDIDKLQIVINNLIDNAIRYTEKGGKVDIATYADAEAVFIEVKDNGIGIADQEKERIFERFYRIIGNPTNGTGLGLAIVKEIVSQHSGWIKVTAGLNQTGSGFIIWMPKNKTAA